ncbi:MAG: glutaminyl-peptide cyclotransferase [Thiohalocapsa sp.]
MVRFIRQRLLWVMLVAGCGVFLLGLGASAPVAGYRVIARFPHDTNAFTQGLAFDADNLYEGTGKRGRSTLRRVDLETGAVLQQTALPPRIFGEGITVWRDEVVQLSWQAHLGMRYDRATFAKVGEFPLPGEGWGITHDGRHWIISDGTDTLRFLDPDSAMEVRRVQVRDGSRAVTRLNELEYIAGEVWANIWYQDRLVRISPATGAVLGYVDLSGLWPPLRLRAEEAVLNGIAYDAEGQRLFVTGKYWPWLYQIEVTP